MPTTGIDVQHNSPPHQGRYTMADEWHYSAGGRPPIGPVSAGELRELAAAGRLAPTDLVWKEGLAEWVPASKLKGLFRGVDKEREPTPSSRVFTDSTNGPTATIASPVPIARLIPASVHVSTAVPWNPIALVVLGLACSPLWAAVMLALNGRRLGSNQSTWIPISLGFGPFLASIGIGFLIDSYAIDLLLYLGSLAGLAGLVVPAQHAAYSQLQPPPPSFGTNWIVPGLIGLPMAAFTFFAFCVVPLIPLEPTEVCEKFAAAKNAGAAEPYTTLNLLPALRALEKVPGNDDPFHFEIADGEDAPPEVGGYLVKFRGATPDSGGWTTVDGFFHLVWRAGAWKIDDLYFTAANGTPLPQWISLAANYRSLLEGASPAKSTKPATKAAPKKGGTWGNWQNYLRVLGTIVACLLGGAAARKDAGQQSESRK